MDFPRKKKLNKILQHKKMCYRLQLLLLCKLYQFYIIYACFAIVFMCSQLFVKHWRSIEKRIIFSQQSPEFRICILLQNSWFSKIFLQGPSKTGNLFPFFTKLLNFYLQTITHFLFRGVNLLYFDIFSLFYSFIKIPHPQYTKLKIFCCMFCFLVTSK